jgi:hypothetical protein
LLDDKWGPPVSSSSHLRFLSPASQPGAPPAVSPASRASLLQAAIKSI